MTSDSETPVQHLRDTVREFVDQRDWRQFHSPKNLSMALAIEAAELMEHFQWLTAEASRELNPSSREAVGEELADVLCYALALSNELELEVSSILMAKMEKNRLKYPVEEYRGRFGPEDSNPVS